MSVFASIAIDKSPEIILEGQRKDEFLETIAGLFDATEATSLKRHKESIVRIRAVKTPDGGRDYFYEGKA